MKVLGYERLIVLAFGEDSSLQSLAKETNGYYMDLQDMKRAAQILDNKEENVLAGIYDELIADVPLSRPVSTEEDEEEFIDEEDDMDDMIASIKKKRSGD